MFRITNPSQVGAIEPNQIIFIVIAMIVVVVVALIVWAIAAARQRRAQRHDVFVSAGFLPVTPVPPELLDHIAALQPYGRSQRLHLHEAYRRSISGGDAYLFDLIDDNSEGQTWMSGSAIAVVAPSLSLPFVALRPKASLDKAFGAFLGSTMEKMLSLATASAGLAEVNYPDDVEFSERFVVVGENEAEVLGLLTNRRRTALLELPENLIIGTRGDTIAISTMPTRTSREVTAASIRALLDAAEHTLALFRS